MVFEKAMDYIKEHVLELAIILLLCIVLIVGLAKEGYLGEPLSTLTDFTYGMKQRAGSQLFTMTNQGEMMMGSRNPPYFPYHPYPKYKVDKNFSNRDNDKLKGPPPAAVTPALVANAAITDTNIKEGYTSVGTMDDNRLHSLLY